MRRLGNICMILGLLLIAGALALFFHNRQDSQRAGKASAGVREKLEETIEKAKETRDPYGGVTWQPGSWDGDDPDAAIPEMPVVTVDGYGYIGVVDIPSLGISLPVMAEWDYDRLKIAPCRYAGSCYTDDLVICGHNYRKHFSPLRSIDIGAEVIFTTMDGMVFHYVVSNRETVQPTDIELMIDTGADWDLTLFTCNLGGQTRCAVRCLRVED